VQGSYVMSPFGLGEALGEFIEAAGAGQRALGGVIGWRQRPVAAGGVAAPDPPPRVLAPQPVQPTGLVVPAVAGGHRWWLFPAAVLLAGWQLVVAADGVAGAPPG
jgi:hypothetical protein